MEVDLQELLVASRQLEMMADVYEEVIGQLQQAGSGATAAFETDDSYAAWIALRDTFWLYAADTQDNLNATSRTLIRYINAVCQQDTENAEDLKASVDSFNVNLDKVEEAFGAPVDDPLPTPDLGNPEQVIEEPSNEPADRPGRG
jgi:hypothetical protein